MAIDIGKQIGNLVKAVGDTVKEDVEKRSNSSSKSSSSGSTQKQVNARAAAKSALENWLVSTNVQATRASRNRRNAEDALKGGYKTDGMMYALEPWRKFDDQLSQVVAERGLPEQFLNSNYDANAWSDVERVRRELIPSNEGLLDSLRRRAATTGSDYDKNAYSTMSSKYQSGLNTYRETLAAGKDKARSYQAQVASLEKRNDEIKRLINGGAGLHPLLEAQRGERDVEALQEEYARNRAEIDRLTPEIERQLSYYYSYIPLAADYEKYSQPEDIEAPNYLDYVNSWEAVGDIFTGPDAEEEERRKYAYINNIDGFADQVKVYQDVQQIRTGGAGKYNEPYAKYDYLTDYERGIYNYLYATQGTEAADAYLSSLDASLNMRQGQGIYENASGFEKAMMLSLIHI